MKIELLRKKFQRELDAWMVSERLDEPTLAWLLNCHERTVKNWTRGRTLPSRDNALVLAFFAPKVKETLEVIAKLPEAKTRWVSSAQESAA